MHSRNGQNVFLFFHLQQKTIWTLYNLCKAQGQAGGRQGHFEERQFSLTSHAHVQTSDQFIEKKLNKFPLLEKN